MKLNRPWLIPASLSVILLLLAIVVALVQYRILMDIETAPHVETGEKPHEIEAKPTLYFGVVSRYSPRKIYSGYQPIMDYLSNNTDWNFELKISRNYDETVRQLVQGEVIVASLGNLVYVSAQRQHPIRPILMPLNASGNPFFRSSIVVREDSPIQRIEDLRGMSFAFTSERSMSHWIPLKLLREAGIRKEDLGKTGSFRHHEVVARNVLRGEYDAGAVKDLVAQEYSRRGLRILMESPPIPGVPLAVRDDVDPEIEKTLRQAFLNLKPEESNFESRMESWDSEFSHGFVPASDRDYEASRQILRELGFWESEE